MWKICEFEIDLYRIACVSDYHSWFMLSCFLTFQPLPPLPPLATPTFSLIPPIMEVHQSSTVSTTTQTTCLSTIKASTTVASTTTPTGIVKPTPSIAVIHTQSFENIEKKINLSQQHVKPVPASHGGKRKDIKKHLQHKNKHSALDRVHRWENFSLRTLIPLLVPCHLMKRKVFCANEIDKTDASYLNLHSHTLFSIFCLMSEKRKLINTFKEKKSLETRTFNGLQTRIRKSGEKFVFVAATW